MVIHTFISFLVLFPVLISTLPTHYEYYTGDGINSGLSADQPYFLLNGKNISIHSGAIHYFRVPHQYWRDRLRKLRAAGMNAVETYVPWNLHEPQQNVYDFGDGGDPKYNMLNITEFLRIAQEEDLFVLLRSGPYICAEWEFGGLPSWILRNPSMVVRTNDEDFLNLVENYFKKLFSIVSPHQFSKGGPIIAFQVENEYGNTQTGDFTPSKEYLEALVTIFKNNGIVELLYSSDSAGRLTVGSLPGTLLQTVNFARNPELEFDLLNSFQKDKPTMAMEYWTGWYDKWLENHSTRDNAEFKDVLQRIIDYPASFNMYMFHGGTSFGFTSGANLGSVDNTWYYPLTNSYDYDAPLAENGDYTEKYEMTQEVLTSFSEQFQTPERPELVPRVAYPDIEIQEQLLIKEVIDAQSTIVSSDSLIPMELLPINDNNGQSFGYIVYSTKIDIAANAALRIIGHVCDTVMVLVNGKLVSKPFENNDDLAGFGFWSAGDSSVVLSTEDLTDATLDIIVENMGRNNFGSLEQFKQYKGFFYSHNVTVDDKPVTNQWEITPLEFKQDWTNQLSGWHEIDGSTIEPSLYRGILNIEGEPQDTYIDMTEWTKGIVIVNGFVLSRHFKSGPQQAAYLPGVFLNEGHNEIIIFEHFKRGDKIKFTTDMIYYI